jgi:MoxR-like ATPase
VAFFTPGLPGESTLTWGLPLFLMGGVGVAKSTTTRDFARTVSCPVEVFSPSERGDAEIGSVPVPSADAQWLTTPKPGWTRRFFDADATHGGRGLILADELTTAEAHVQDALAGLVLDRRIAGSHLGGGIRVFAAGNPPGSTGGGRPLAKMLANRLIHVPVAAPTAAERYEYLRARLAGTGLVYTQDVDAAREEARETLEEVRRAMGLDYLR